MQQLLTTDDVINALGVTNGEVAKLLGVKYNNITNWRSFGYFPPDTYVMIQKELADRGLIAPAYLWKMRTLTKKRRKKTC